MDIQTDKMSAKILHSYTSFIATMIGGPTLTYSLTTVETSGSRFGWLAWFFGCCRLNMRISPSMTIKKVAFYLPILIIFYYIRVDVF